MQVLIAFLVLVFVLGGTGLGDRMRRRPILLLGLSTVIAASFYTLRVAL